MTMSVDREKLMQLFSVESLENLQTLQNGLLSLEKEGRDEELLNTLMRITHTMKGSASLFGLWSIEQLSHSLEDVFTDIISFKIDLTRDRMNALLEASDLVKALLENEARWKGDEIDEQFMNSFCETLKNLFIENHTDSENTEAEQNPKSKVTRESKDGRISPNTHQNHYESIRVDTARINELMNLAGEQLVSKIQIEESLKQLDLLLPELCDHTVRETVYSLQEQVENLSLSIARMQQEILDIRMIPVSSLFYSFPKGIRELAQQKGKEVELIIEGEETELDKSITDQLKEPLLHLLRNAVDHGLETPDERLKSGKYQRGTITLRAFQQGAQICIEIEDDGKGISTETVLEKAIEQEIISADTTQQMEDEDIYDLLFAPGFSTKETIDTTSGRGVGLDVVKEKISHLKGGVFVSSTPGKGTTFRLLLPLTLAITEVLLVTVGSEIFAIPIEVIHETVRIDSHEIKKSESKEAIVIRDEIIPVIRLLNLFNLPKKGISEDQNHTVVIVNALGRKAALLVDSVKERQGVVSKPLQYPLRNTKHIAGGTVLGNGSVVLILDVSNITDSSHYRAVPNIEIPDNSPKVEGQSKSILIAEDSMATALLEKSVLESVGFQVVIAKNGREAFHLAQQELFDLVISDVLMPEMDGFELTALLKKDPIYKDIPVIIVTTRESSEDKIRGLTAGASAYMLKKEFTSEGLLSTIDRLVR